MENFSNDPPQLHHPHAHLLKHAEAGHKIVPGLIDVVRDIANSPDNDYAAQMAENTQWYSDVVKLTGSETEAVKNQDRASLIGLGWTDGNTKPDHMVDCVACVAGDKVARVACVSLTGGWYAHTQSAGWPCDVVAWKPACTQKPHYP